MSELRSWHWGLAFVLAIALHLGAYLALQATPATPQHSRGGGEFEGLGEREENTQGLLVSLGQPDAPAPQEPTPVPEAAPEAPPAAPPPAPQAALPDPAEALPENSDPPLEAAEEAPPTPQPSNPSEIAPAPEPEPESVSPPPREQQQVAKLTPPLPPRKPQPPLPKPDFGLVEPRLPVEGPAEEAPPTPQQTAPQQPADQPEPAQTATTPNSAVQATEAQTAELVQSAKEGRLGTASARQDGDVPTLNYKDRVLLWLKRHGGYPRESYRYRHEGVVLLEFEIDRTGRVIYYHVARSSGYHLLDQEVKRMMERASPVPPIPAEIAQDRMQFTIPVRFIYG